MRFCIAKIAAPHSASSNIAMKIESRWMELSTFFDQADCYTPLWYLGRVGSSMMIFAIQNIDNALLQRSFKRVPPLR